MMSKRGAFINAALDAENYTLALSLVEDKIKQNSEDLYFQALRCEVLSHINDRQEEALNSTLELLGKLPKDQEIISKLSATFEYLDYELNEDIYETICRKASSPELTMVWFRDALSRCDMISMQKASVTLSNALGPTKYGKLVKWWAVTCMYLALVCCPNRLDNSRGKLLPIMGLKFIDSLNDSVNDPQKLFIKCKLLLLRNDIDGCLAELRDFLGKEGDLELQLLYFETLKKKEYWEELWDACIKYLVDICVDDWDTWKLLIFSAKKLGRVDECLKVINNYTVGRNTQLALIQISENDGKLCAIENYIKLFGHKLCCFIDLKIFLNNATNIDNILNKELERRNIENILSGKNKATEKELIFMVNYMKIKAYTDRELFNSEDFILQCCDFYNSTKHLLNKLPQYDYFSGFEFIILAIEALLTQATGTDTDLYLKIIIILENALVQNVYEFHLLLWLAILYNKVNMSSKSTEIFQRLKIKSMQFDTLSPYFTTRMATFSRDDSIMYQATQFYTQNVPNELPTMIFEAFSNLTLSKLQGFLEVKLRFDNSLTKLINCLGMCQASRLSDEPFYIESTYKYVLKNGYKILKKSGDDLDMKISDNIDRSIIWDCGIHEKVDSVSKAFDKTNPTVDTRYVELMILKELIIYDQNSRLFQEYKENFLMIYKNNLNEIKLTTMEKWNLSVIALLLDNSVENLELPKEPTDLLNFEFNHYFFTLLDVDKQLDSIIEYKNDFFDSRLDRIKEKKNYVSSVCKQILNKKTRFRESSVLQIKESKNRINQWFNNSIIGKRFEIDSKFITTLYDSFKEYNENSIKAI